MGSRLRAAADAFIYDVAMLLHVMDSLDDGDLGRGSASTGWTLRQTFGHLAVSYERYAGAIERRVAGEYAPWEPVPSTVTVDAEKDTPIATLVSRMLSARARILQALGGVTPAMELSPLAEGFPPLREAVSSWSLHGSGHALDFIETVPDLASDPLILGWVLYPWPGEPPSFDDRRRTLLKALKSAPKESPS